ncbi:MAG TPA: flagellar hook-length control protein FliK [Telluria sp.]
MQNHTLPIQLSPTSVAPPPARVAPQPNSDGASFSQSLNREMAQRQAAAVANKPAPPVKQGPVANAAPPVKQGPVANAAPPVKAAPQPDAPGPTRAEKHLANVDDAQAPDAPATTPPDDAATAAAAAAATAAVVAEPVLTDAAAAAAAEGAAAAAPMTDMLAMVASYKQLMQGGPAKTSAAPTDTATTAPAVRGTGVAADTQTLAALQSALKNSDDGAAAGKQAALATPDDDPAAARARPAPDLATIATSKAPQSDTALSTLRDAAAAAPVKDSAPVTGSAFQAQLNSVEMGKTGVTPASEHIPARLGTTAWDNQVSQKVVWMVGGMDQSATLTLNPPDLGPVQVVLNVNNDQATVAFSSATPEVRAALENAMPRLRDMLGEAGVTLGEASVSANMPDQRQADTSGGNDSRNGRNNGGNGNGVRSGEAEIPLPRSANRAASNDGAVDTFA